MESLNVPRFLLSGLKSGVGRSLVGIGLASEFQRRKIGLSCGVMGPQLAQASIYRRFTKRSVRCFDERLVNLGQMLVGLYQSCSGAEIIMLEGQRGLFEGNLPGSARGSDAEFAALTRTPVILILSAQNNEFRELEKAGLLLGQTQGLSIPGFIINRIPAGISKEELDGVVQRVGQILGGAKYLGGISELGIDIQLPSAELNQSKNLSTLPLQMIVSLGREFNQSLKLEGLLQIAAQAPTLTISDYDDRPAARRCHIAISDDSCFNLSIHDNSEILRYFGAELIPFSPLADMALPRTVGGVYLTGGYLSEYADEIANNRNLWQSLRNFADAGGVIYAEGSGLALLCREFSIRRGQPNLPGVGLIPANVSIKRPKTAFMEATTIDHSILGRPGLTVKGVTTNEWRLSEEGSIVRIMRMARTIGLASLDGYSPLPQMVGTFSFLHFGSCPEMAQSLVDAAQVVEKLK